MSCESQVVFEPQNWVALIIPEIVGRRPGPSTQSEAEAASESDSNEFKLMGRLCLRLRPRPGLRLRTAGLMRDLVSE